METNRIIAEFMGIKVPIENGDEIERLAIQNGDELWYSHELEYHDSWEWLMPVVEKIESLGFEFNIGGDVVRIFDMNGNELIDTSASTKIQSIYQAIVRFVSEISN
jgi:hypothetical protein